MLDFTATTSPGSAPSPPRAAELLNFYRGGTVSMQPVSPAPARHDTRTLRGWQRRALVKYLGAEPRDFLAVATPGSGKTAFALRIAAELLGHRAVEQITVVVPTEHLKIQWAQAAGRQGTLAGPEVLQLQPPDLAGVPRRSRHLRPGGRASRRCTGCAPSSARRWSSSTRSTTAVTPRPGATPSGRHSATPPADLP